MKLNPLRVVSWKTIFFFNISADVNLKSRFLKKYPTDADEIDRASEIYTNMRCKIGTQL